MTQARPAVVSAPEALVQPLIRAVQVLAGACDGARDVDGQGFNKMDAAFGHTLATLPASWWTDAQARSAWLLLRKYRTQLAAAGIDYAALTEPPPPARSMQLEGDRVAIRSPFNADLVAAIKAIPGRLWVSDRRVWTVPVVQAKALSDLATRFEIHIDESVVECLTAAPATDGPPDAAPAPPQQAERSVAWDGQDFLLRAPYDVALVTETRDLPGARWDRRLSVWRIPGTPDTIPPLRALAARHDLLLAPAVESAFGTLRGDAVRNLEASTATDAELAPIVGLGGELMGFQKAGVAQVVRLKRALIADEMGLGKTVQALAALLALQAFPALVVCPASLKPNWLREARKWLPGKRIGILNGGSGGSEYDRYMISRSDVVIVNYDLLHRRREVLATAPWRAIVGDEAHQCKNYKAIRTKEFRALAKGLGVVLLLTGTPVLNRPGELTTLLQILGVLDKLGGLWGFLRSCGVEKGRFGMEEIAESRAQHQQRLALVNARLRQTCMIRRLKADVLKDLPPKRHSTVTLPITNRAEYDAAERDIVAWLLEHDPEKADAATRAEQLVRVERLKQIAVKGKLAALEEWVGDFVESGEKLILFAHHVAVQHQLAATMRARLGERAVVTLMAEQSTTERDEAVRIFQTDERVRVIVASLKAGGVGHTMTAASNVAFAEFGWTPGDHDQAIDRAHRIGQQASVTAWYLAGDATIDERILRVIAGKRVTVNALTDGITASGDASVMRDLLQDLRKGKSP